MNNVLTNYITEDIVAYVMNKGVDQYKTEPVSRPDGDYDGDIPFEKKLATSWYCPYEESYHCDGNCYYCG